ncbi:MAG TPA: toll/interleukin-1 receptor domain-containing protein [Polyangiaceae bacterium]|nr:toll/interleukin-1 receptor domain-containing protein [Polyangiaceae bacterium]
MARVTSAELVQRYTAGLRDFSGADLRRADLCGANLCLTNFRRANLRRARLVGANLSEASLRDANLGGADLGSANLSAADLSTANLSGADLSNANLSSADLSSANLNSTDLRGANLRGANLRGALLSHANLGFAEVAGADFRAANLAKANLGSWKPDAATTIGMTILASVDLTALCASDVTHALGSVVDHESVVMSLAAPQLKEFLRRTGMPDVFVEYMIDCARSLDPQEVFSLLRSTFISYGGPDEGFARKLNAALEMQGVNTFFFKDDAAPGERLHRVMRRGVNEHDRVILICSRASLARPGLLNELEETLAREARDSGNAYLIPVRLDDYVIDGWSPDRSDLALAVRDRVIADFRNHEDTDAFKAEVAKLIVALRVQPKVAPPPNGA